MTTKVRAQVKERRLSFSALPRGMRSWDSTYRDNPRLLDPSDRAGPGRTIGFVMWVVEMLFIISTGVCGPPLQFAR